jgi:hypothetical protein
MGYEKAQKRSKTPDARPKTLIATKTRRHTNLFLAGKKGGGSIYYLLFFLMGIVVLGIMARYEKIISTFAGIRMG